MSDAIPLDEKILKLIWMVRPDLRHGDGADGHLSDEFRIWWHLESAVSFPAWTCHGPIANADLLSPMSGWASHGRFGMSKALRYVMGRRADLRAAFDVSTEDGLWSAVAWFFTHGVREYGLLERLDGEAVAALDEPPAFLALSGAGNAPQPMLSWLMYFVWRSMRDLQEMFDLRTAEGQAFYVQWFLFDGVPRLQLGTLVGTRWRAWLRQPIQSAHDDVAVPRAAILLWCRRPELQQAFDFHSAAGRRALSDWVEGAWKVEPCLSWTDAAAPRGDPGFATGEPHGRVRPFGVNLIGFAYGELGIGEDVRMAAAACEAAGIPFSVVNIHPGDRLRQEDRILERHVGDGSDRAAAPYAVNLLCLTGFDTVRVYLERGMALFGGRYNIGWWPWELPVWPHAWQGAFDVVDEVWAATTFTQDMYRQAIGASPAGKPVVRMPLPASVARVRPIHRVELGIPADTFVFLFVFDFNSHLSRKNPLATIDAFQKAFAPHDRSVSLVLKTMNSDPDNPAWQRFLEICRRDPRIVLIEHTMDRGHVLGLIEACDAYVSLHRAEGFGRTLAEAMLFGKPVIGTAFSGNVDFLHAGVGFPVRWRQVAVGEDDYPFVTAHDQAWWADPDTDHAAQQMLAVRRRGRDAGFRQAVRDHAGTRFSESRIGQLMLQRLARISGAAGRSGMA